MSGAAATSRWAVGRAMAGATPAQDLPDPAVEWGWSAQQAYAVATARRVNELEQAVSDNGNLSLVLAAAVALAAGAASAWGFLELARRRRG